jgi:hypothetical protein
MIFNRPWIVFLQFMATLIFSAVSWFRFGMALSLWEFLTSLPLAVSPLYQLLTGLVWGVAGLWMCIWLWRGNPKAPLTFSILSVTFALYYWADQFLLTTSEIRQTNWLFSGIVTLVLLLLVFLSLKPTAVKVFFGEKYEQEE